MNDLTVKLKFKDGSEDGINPLISITPFSDHSICVFNGLGDYTFKLSDIEEIKIEELK